MKIEVEPTRLHGTAAQLRALSADSEACMDRIAELVFETDGAWRGDAERAFAAKLLLVLGEFRAIHAFADEFAGLLERFADQYEAFDASLAAKIDLAE